MCKGVCSSPSVTAWKTRMPGTDNSWPFSRCTTHGGIDASYVCICACVCIYAFIGNEIMTLHKIMLFKWNWCNIKLAILKRTIQRHMQKPPLSNSKIFSLPQNTLPCSQGSQSVSSSHHGPVFCLCGFTYSEKFHINGIIWDLCAWLSHSITFSRFIQVVANTTFHSFL